MIFISNIEGWNLHLYAVKGIDNVYPRHKRAMVGDNVTFNCTSSGRIVKWTFVASSGRNVNWIFVEREFPQNTIPQKQLVEGIYYFTLNIVSVDYYNEGTYTCYGKDFDGFFFKDEGTLELHGEAYHGMSEIFIAHKVVCYILWLRFSFIILICVIWIVGGTLVKCRVWSNMHFERLH